MQYLGDYSEDYSTLNFKFHSRNLSQVPTSLLGSPVISVYKANGTTQSIAGVTLTVDFDSVTGLNNVLIDLSADAFYAIGNDYQVVITTGTVDSISVVGTVLAHFSIENRFNEVTVTTNNDKTGYALSSAGVTAVQSGLSTLTASDVWGYATRTLSSFGTLVSDIWSAVTRTITGGTITTNSDKIGYSLSITPPTAVEIRQEIDSNSTRLSDINGITDKLDTAMQLDGAVYQFTTNALENAPSSSGGDATAANQAIIIGHLTGIKGATFDTSTDSLEAIRDRGDAAWVTGSGLSGSNTVLLTIQDGSSHNIVGAFVDIFDSANTTFLQRAISNSSGQVSFSMDDGTYYVRIVKGGYSFTAVSMVINGNYTYTYNMTVYTISGPALPTLCRVYTYIFKPDGTYHTTLSGVATVGVYTDDNQYYTCESTAVYDNTTGLIYWDIVQGASASLTITELEYFGKTITVPALATSELNDL